MLMIQGEYEEHGKKRNWVKLAGTEAIAQICTPFSRGVVAVSV